MFLEEAEERYYIKDKLGRVPCNSMSYIQMGKKEGWLIYRGSYRDHREVICHIYEFKE